MDRELLLEIGCEELPASWLPPADAAARRAARRAAGCVSHRGRAPPSRRTRTPRRLTAAIARISERQTDLEEQVTGPPASAAFAPDGQPTPAALGFARKAGIEPSALATVDTPKGRYLAYTRHERGKATVDVLPDVLAATLRDLAFPKQMRWDAWLDDGRGEFTFGRPIRWILFLHGGRVVPFTIRRNALAQTTSVQDVRSGAVTYGHRVLAGSGRAGRALRCDRSPTTARSSASTSCCSSARSVMRASRASSTRTRGGSADASAAPAARRPACSRRSSI